VEPTEHRSIGGMEVDFGARGHKLACHRRWNELQRLQQAGELIFEVAPRLGRPDGGTNRGADDGSGSL